MYYVIFPRVKPPTQCDTPHADAADVSVESVGILQQHLLNMMLSLTEIPSFSGDPLDFSKFWSMIQQIHLSLMEKCCLASAYSQLELPRRPLPLFYSQGITRQSRYCSIASETPYGIAQHWSDKFLDFKMMKDSKQLQDM